jgi:hypothetical protein
MRLHLDTHSLLWWHVLRRFYFLALCFLALWGGACNAPQGVLSQFERRVNHIDTIVSFMPPPPDVTILKAAAKRFLP